MNIPLEQLAPCGFNSYEIEDVDILANEIKIAGLITPLSVIGPMDDGTYRILSGERRFCALSLIHKDDPECYHFVPCSIIGDKSMPLYTQKLIMEIANEGARRFDSIPHRFNIINLLKEMVENGDLPERKVAAKMADYLGISKKYARYYRAVVFKGMPELQDLVQSGKVNIKDASAISQMEKEKQNDFITRVKNGEPAGEILKEYRTEKTSDEKVPDVKKTESLEEYHDLESAGSISEENGKQNIDDYNDEEIIPEINITETPQQEPCVEPKHESPEIQHAYNPDAYDPSTFDASILGGFFGESEDVTFHDEKESQANDECCPFHTLRKWLNHILEKEGELSSEEEDIVTLCTEISEKYSY